MITIIIIIILATVTINFTFGENGLITRAQQAKEQMEISSIKERLELAVGVAYLEGKGTIDPDYYFDLIEGEGIIVDRDTDVVDNEDGTYEITTEQGYVFEITLLPNKENPTNMEIEYIGKENNLGPRIREIKTSTTTNSISIEVETRNAEGGTYTYSYKKAGEENWIEAETSQSNTCTIEGLEAGTTYIVQVKVETANGETTKEKEVIVGEMPGKGTITFEETEWQGDGTASIKIETSETGYTLQYQKNSYEGSWTDITSGEIINNLIHGDTVYARLWDGTNESDYASVSVEDDIAPEVEINTSNLTSNSVTLNVIASDEQSGLATSGTYKYYLGNELKVTNTSNTYTFEDIFSSTEYTVRVEVYDKAGNANEDSIKINTQISEIEQARESQEIFTQKTTLKDKYTNDITIPEGFKIVADSGLTVQQGIVIEDVSASTDDKVQGSQYVWIPVGTFIKDDGTLSDEIVLGRYTFDAAGNAKLVQNSENYEDQSEAIEIDDTDSTTFIGSYKELTYYRVGVNGGTNGQNASAYNLGAFINSANSNKGYYIGRYEASYASGAESETSVTDYSICKAASKKSSSYSVTTQYISGNLWNRITQINASKVAINTYADSDVVKSDLMNSYAWDTAIVYIQEAGNGNYANQTSKNTSLNNTGNNQDEVCKINDLSSNVGEWTTEYCNLIDDENTTRPCSYRGGLYASSSNHTAMRWRAVTSGAYGYIGFRINLYIE